MESIKAAFVDRDGTIIIDTHYPSNPEELEFLPGAVEGLRILSSKGYTLFVVSNQSGVGRGLITDEQFEAVHRRFCEMLQGQGIEIAEFAYCLHKPEDDCVCRKPEPGLIPKDFEGTSIDFSRSLVIGDNSSDVELGHRAGMESYLVLTGRGEEARNKLQSLPENHVYPDLLTLAQNLS